MDVHSTNDVNAARARLERDPLRNIVLLKHIEAFREHISVVEVSAGRSAATLVLLDTSASAYDRETYPEASFAALISSDCPQLTDDLMGPCRVSAMSSSSCAMTPIGTSSPSIFRSAGQRAFCRSPPASRSTSLPTRTYPLPIQRPRRCWTCSSPRDIRESGCVPCCRPAMRSRARWNRIGILVPCAWRSRTIGESGKSEASSHRFSIEARASPRESCAVRSPSCGGAGWCRGTR